MIVTVSSSRVSRAKRSRRVGQIDELVFPCYARGMSTRDIEAHLFEVYGVKASREMVSSITDVVADEIEIWRNRPVEEGSTRSSTSTASASRSGTGGGHDDQERAPGHRSRRAGPQARPGLLDSRDRGREVSWRSVLTQLRNHGLRDILIACCVGVKLCT